VWKKVKGSYTMERVLVVDDEIAVCDALKEFLSLKEYEVETALDGPTALKKVEEFKPHIVLLDIIMRGMGGVDVLKEIRSKNPQIGIIMVSAVKDEKIAKRTIQLGAYDYITKPINLNHLNTVLMVKMLDIMGQYNLIDTQGNLMENEENRREERFEYELPEFVYVEFQLGKTPIKGKVFDLKVMDYSRNGLGIVVTQKDSELLQMVDEGDKLKNMTFCASWTMIKVDGIVRHKSKIKDGKYKGCVILGIESPDIIESCKPVKL
jgi:CheY-like chemotaxis protein